MPSKTLCSLLLICCFVSVSFVGLACSAKGPADPMTGMISYPPGAGNSEGSTSVPANGLEGTPFEGGKYYKGWVANSMKLLVVPAGTTLAFEGVIETTDDTRPPHWEEGEMNSLGGTTVDAAPRPEWTISGNGRGDYRDGVIPPAIPGLKLVDFEGPPSVIIAEDTPNEKALWKMTYDRDTAVKVLVSIWDDPVVRALYLSGANIPAGFDIRQIADQANQPQVDGGARSLNEFELSAVSEGGVANLRSAFDSTLVQRSEQIIQNSATISRTYLRTDGSEFTRDVAEDARIIIRAGYIAMQGAAAMDFYPTNKYSTKYFVTPPSANQYEIGKSKVTLEFTTATAPDYWEIDLHSGLESARDCVWAWIEAEVRPKPEDSTIADPSDIKNFYEMVPDSYAIGGVFVQGLYQSGESSVGRNTLTYVVVADTQSPAHYAWESGNISAQTGQTLNNGGDSISFRVFDNNPVIGAAGSHNNIFDMLPGLEDFSYVEAGRRPENAPNNPEVFTRYLEPVREGFDQANLQPELHYNVCVPVFAGFKVDENPRTYTGPLPLVNDVLVLPLQKFVWKKADPDQMTISDFKIHNKSGDVAARLDSLQNEAEWKGYSSYLVTVAAGAMTEHVGYGIADNSVNNTLSISNDLKAQTPGKNLFSEGIPVDAQSVFYQGWNDQAMKLFVSASDGITVRNGDGSINKDLSNRTPSYSGTLSLESLLDTKFSGAELKFNTGYEDFVALWSDPATVAQLAAGVQASELVVGGELGGCSLPSTVNAPGGAWGKFKYVSTLTDTGKPNIALEVVNSKNEKAVTYGNLNAMGEHANLLTALEGAGTDNWAVAADTNDGDNTYSSDSPNYNDAAWEFSDKINTDLYLDMSQSMDSNKFKPWLYAFSSNAESSLWPSGYWNGTTTYNNDRLAFQQGSRDRLIFRYWVWDNINPFLAHNSIPNGVRIDADFKKSRFKGVSGYTNAEITLIDSPGRGGEVSVDNVWWPDYIFHNPSLSINEECSIALQVEDERSNIRRLKLWFRVVPPSRETIRTLEERRSRDFSQ